MGLSARSTAACVAGLVLLLLASAASAQQGMSLAAPGGAMGSGGSGGMMGAGGQSQTLEEPKTRLNEVQDLQFAIQAVKLALETYNEGSTDEQGAPPGSGRYATGKGDIDAQTNEKGALKKELYRTLWALYDRIGQYYRQRDQLADAATVYEECLGYMPKDSSWPTYSSGSSGGSAGGSGGMAGPGMMGPGGPGGSGGSSRGMMGPGGGSGGPGMMAPGGSGGSGGMAGPGGMMGGGGGASGGAADVWDELSGEMRELVRTEILGPAYFRLGQVYYESYRLQEAQEVLYANCAVPEHPVVGGHPDSLKLLSQIELLLGMDEVAEGHAHGAAALSGASASAQTNAGIASYRQGRLLDALEKFRAAVAQPLAADGYNAEAQIVAHNYLGTISMSRGEWREADQSFRMMVELLPAWDKRLQGEKRYSLYRDGQRRMLSATVAAYSNLGTIAQRESRYDDAVALNQGAVKAADLLARLEQSDTGATVGDMDRALAVVAAAYQNAAVAYLARGGANQGKTHGGKDLGGAMADYQAAVELLERAVASAPQSAEAWNCLGKAYYSARKYYDAESCFEHAVQLNGDKTEYRVNLQAVGERLGSAPRDPR